MYTLQTLSLAYSNVEYIESEDTFLEVPLLEVLGLDGKQLSHTIEDTHEPFHILNHLKQLTLSRNAIKSVGAKALDGLDNLEQVNPISNLKLVVFLIVRLLQLDLSDNEQLTSEKKNQQISQISSSYQLIRSFKKCIV